MLADDSYTEETLRQTRIGRSMGTDYFGLRDELTDTERDYLQRTREFIDTEVVPVKAKRVADILPRLRALAPA